MVDNSEDSTIWMPSALKARSERLKILLDDAKSRPLKLPDGKMTKQVAEFLVAVRFPEMTNHTRHSYAEALIQLYNRDVSSQ